MLDEKSPVTTMASVLERVCDRIFTIGLLGAVCSVLWLPVFPSGDGPVHIYYADVLWSLVRHQPQYAHDYAIRHLVAPYLVHYLALVSFEQFVAPAMAEKLFVALIFVVTAFGFRALARTLGEHAGIACLWMLPLLFSWSLGGGFLNCCFATGIALWSFAVWVLLGEARGKRAVRLLLAAYTGLLLVLALSHPVPLLVLLLFTGSDLAICAVERRLRGASHWASLLPHAVAFALSCCVFLAPVLLAEKGQAAAVLPEIGFHADVLAELATGMRLGYFAALDLHTVTGWLSIASRILLVSIVPGVAVLLGAGKWWGRKSIGPASSSNIASQPAPRELRFYPTTPASRLLVISIIYLISTVFFPRSLNHSYFFPQRMWDIVWLLVLGCGSAATLTNISCRWLAGMGLVSIFLTAGTGLPALVSIARAQERLAAVPLPGGGRGLLVESDSAVEERGSATSYPVYFWAGVRAFAASHAILLNSPWLGLTILPVKGAPGAWGPKALLDRGLPSIYSESPLELTHVLMPAKSESGSTSGHPSGDRQGGAGANRKAILARADFLLYVDPASLALKDGAREGAQTRQAALALIGPDSAAWQCDAETFYAVCTRAR